MGTLSKRSQVKVQARPEMSLKVFFPLAHPEELSHKMSTTTKILSVEGADDDGEDWSMVGP